MQEADAQLVQFVRAVEQADAEGALLPPAERRRAADPETAQAGDEQTRLLTRARSLHAAVRERVPGVDALLAVTAARVPLTGLIYGAALLFGLLSSAVGPSQRVHLLQAPLLALVVFNFVVYAVLAIRALRSSRPRAAPRAPGAARLLAAAWARRAAAAFTNVLGDRVSDRSTAIARAQREYLALWGRTAAPLLEARVVRTFHVGAALAVVGAVLSMYLRGVVLKYEATWESTFLDAAQVQGFLAVVLAPGRWLGLTMPDVAPLQTAPSSAAPWMHLYAVAALVYVVIPRTVLALFAGRHAATLSADLPLDTGAPYFRRLFAGSRGGGAIVRLLPYSYTLDVRGRDALTELLRDVFGSRAVLSPADPLEYGAEDDDLDAALGKTDGDAHDGGTHQGNARHIVALFSLAQTPELEVHGALLTALKARTKDDAKLLVIVDASAYRQRLAGDAADADAPEATERLAQRRRAWDRIGADAGVPLVHLDLGRPAGDAALATTTAGLWSRATESSR